MARVANTPRVIARNSMAHTEGGIHANNTHLKEGDTGITRLRDEPTVKFVRGTVDDYQSQLNTEGARAISKACQMILWYIGDIGIPVPTAYTDAEVDAIDEDIRTHEVE